MLARYTRPPMGEVWSDAKKLALWLDVELAALDGLARTGAVPADAAAEARARVRPPSPEEVNARERVTGHDVAAFVDLVAEQLGETGRWLHHGLTSSDVTDTALALQIQAAGRLVVEGIDRATAAVVARAHEHRDTLQMGRTHGVHAEPITFGLKLAGWAFELHRTRGRLTRALEGARVGKLSGAVGTYATVDPEVERIACERLGLVPAPVSTQIVQRDHHADVLAALALAGTSLERFAVEFRHLARTEVREVQEPFSPTQKGSSAMPHKRNPIVAEAICGLARVVRAAALVGFENVALWHERDISHSSAERVVLPDAFIAVDCMLDWFASLVETMVVDAERMRANLEGSQFVFLSQRVLLALVDAGMARDDAYRLVQGHALAASNGGRDFRALVESDPEIADRIDVARAFDLASYTRYVSTIFDRLAVIRNGTPAADADSCIQTSSGKRVDPFAPRSDDVEIADIARALANQCRFGGHCSVFYSVAQHSCLTADLVARSDDDPEALLRALLHDAAEAYLGDLPGPVKHHSELGRLYHEAEVRIHETICRRFELGVEQPRHLREVDRALLAAERRELMVDAWEWPDLGDVSPADVSIEPWPPERARVEFLHRFEELDRRRGRTSEATAGPGRPL